MLHLPLEIGIVVERDLVAQIELEPNAFITAGQREPVAEIEAGREPAAGLGHAGARIGVRQASRRHRCDHECAWRRPQVEPQAGVEDERPNVRDAGDVVALLAAGGSQNVTGWSLIARMIVSYWRFALRRCVILPGVIGAGVKRAASDRTQARVVGRGINPGQIETRRRHLRDRER